MGFVDEFLVFGVIDEVDRREFDLAPPPPTATSSTPPPLLASTISSASPSKAEDGQTKIVEYFSPVASPSRKGKERAVDESATAIDAEVLPSVRWGFVVSDTKTRFVSFTAGHLRSR